MVKKKITPTLRFPKFESAWDEKTLGEIGTFIGGGTPSTKNIDFWGGDIPWVSSSDLSDENIYSLKTSRFITSDAISQSATRLIPEKSILIVSRVGVGKVVVNDVELCTSQDFTNLIPHSDNYLFLAYLIKFRTNKLLEFNQGTSIKGFVKSDLENLRVPLPSPPEQQKIASFLTSVDERIQQLTRKKKLLEQYKKGVMQKIFSREIRFKDDKGKDFPEWEEKTLEAVGVNIIGLTYSPSDVVKTGGILVLRSSNIKEDVIDLNDQVRVSSVIPEKLLIKQGDILICTRNGSQRLIGKNIFINDLTETMTFGAFMSVFRSEQNNFIAHLFKSSWYNEQIQMNLGARINQITTGHLNKFKFDFPSIPEQKKIADFLSFIDKKIDLVNTQLQKTKAWKKGLLQKMFV